MRTQLARAAMALLLIVTASQLSVVAPVVAAETGVVVVAVVDDGERPDGSAGSPLEPARIEIWLDDGDGVFIWHIDARVVDGFASADEPFRAEGVPSGELWVLVEQPPTGYNASGPLLIELNTDPAVDCYYGEAPTPGCDAGDGNTHVTFSLSLEYWVRTIGISTSSDSEDVVLGATYDVRKDDGDRDLDDGDAVVFGPAVDTEGGLQTERLDPGDYWIVQLEAPDGFARADPLLVELNLDPNLTCSWHSWQEPSCEEGGTATGAHIRVDRLSGSGSSNAAPPPTDLEVVPSHDPGWGARNIWPPLLAGAFSAAAYLTTWLVTRRRGRTPRGE